MNAVSVIQIIRCLNPGPFEPGDRHVREYEGRLLDDDGQETLAGVQRIRHATDSENYYPEDYFTMAMESTGGFYVVRDVPTQAQCDARLVKIETTIRLYRAGTINFLEWIAMIDVEPVTKADADRWRLMN